jgi:hypothetical protein
MSISSSSPDPAFTFTAPSPVPHPSNYLIPGLIPRRSINLVIGPAKSGRSSLLLPQFNSYLASHQFLDYPLDTDQRPEQIAALLCQRPIDWMMHKTRSLKLEALTYPSLFPIEYWNGRPGTAWQDTLSLHLDHQTVASQGRRPRLLYVEGFQMMMPDGKLNDPGAVNGFLGSLQEFCTEQDLAIIGTVGMAKMKAGENYPLLQQRVMGSVQWAESASTLIGVQILDANLPASRRSTWREITVMARGDAPRTLYADFDGAGRLVPTDKPSVAAESQSEQEMDALLAARKPGEQFVRQDFLDWGGIRSLSVRTVDRWIASRVELGMLDKKGNTSSTIYWKPTEN